MNPLHTNAGQWRKPSRFGASDVATIVAAVLALTATLPVGVVATSALSGLTVMLIGWPAGLLAVVVARWARQRDFRFIALAVGLATVAAASAAISVLLTR